MTAVQDVTTPRPPAGRPRGGRGRRAVRLVCGLLVVAAVAAAGLELDHRLNTIDLPRVNQPTQDGYTLTVYFTPSEVYYHGPRRSIRDQVCAGQSLPDGYPADYLDRVGLEGFGRTARGDYLGWDFTRHCYFATDRPPVGSHENPLVPWQSVAANQLSPGTRIHVVDCGRGLAPDTCARVKSADWRVDDLCSIGCDDAKHLDLYIGEQTAANLEDQDSYFVTTSARVEAREPEPAD
ncbi:hypothetical protein ACFXDE_04475 [Kitasatospora sp. NPDC059408]|uniref:hypothetical protein n=1 Tax=Kitasatospora sp. NPDC059408 TaxID=3346823 RepID=UPI00368615AB